MTRIITQEWEYNEDLRYLGRTLIFGWVSDKRDLIESEVIKSKYKVIYDMIHHSKDHIRNCNVTDKKIVEIIDSITSLR